MTMVKLKTPKSKGKSKNNEKRPGRPADTNKDSEKCFLPSKEEDRNGNCAKNETIKLDLTLRRHEVRNVKIFVNKLRQ